MKYYLVAGALCSSLALAGCQTTESIDETVQSSLPQICEAGKTAYATLEALRAADELSDKVWNLANAGMNSLAPLCEDPSKVTTASVLVQATSAYILITRALRDAE